MSDKIDKSQTVSKGNNNLSRAQLRNVRVKERKQQKLASTQTEQTSSTEIPKETHSQHVDNNDIIAPQIPYKEEDDIIKKESNILTHEDKVKNKKATRESLRDKQFVNRKKRRERHEKRKAELLQTAISKLKTYNKNDTDALSTLEKSLNHKMSSDKIHTDIQTSISEKEILENATPKEPAKSEPPKAQSAKDRFKNALKKISTSLNEDTKSETVHNTAPETPQELAFKKKLHDRNRIKKMVTEYLENMGLSYAQGNFQILCNNITDTLLLSLEAVPQKNKKRVEQLQKRSSLPVRSGNNVLNMKLKKTRPAEIVGDLFSKYDIDSKKNKIIIKPQSDSEYIKILIENSDELSENIPPKIQQELGHHAPLSLDKNIVQSQHKENINIQNSADFDSHSRVTPITEVNHSTVVQSSVNLKDLLQKNANTSLDKLQNLKSRLKNLH